MADAIRFKQTLCVDTQRNQSIEEDAKALFAYAGIHDRSFDDEISDAFATLDSAVWDDDGDVQGVWSIDTARLKGVGSGGGVWDWLLSEDDYPSEAILTVYKSSTRGGLYFRATDSNDNYLFFWDADSAGFLKKTGGTFATLVDVPKVFTGEGDVTLSWREIKFSATADEKWLFMAAWMDGELIVSTADDITGATVGNKIGFAVYHNETVYFDDLRIPKLTEIVDQCGLDIGDSPGSALSRMIGGRHILYFLRYDGTLRMWRPIATAASTRTYQRHFTSFDYRVDSRRLIAHWRQVGAWTQADRFDATIIQRGISRFHRDDNPNLLTTQACYDEAGYGLQAAKESADQVDIEVPAQVLQEPEDVVTILFARDGNTVINSVDYIVDLNRPFAIAYRKIGKGFALKARLFLRKQV